MTHVPYRLLLGEVPTDAAVTSRRTAVKALVRRGPDVLMLYAPALQVYKCPGGGVEPGETAAEALARELTEETGLTLVRIGVTVAEVIEQRRDTRDRDGVFVMTSSYVECVVENRGLERQLDPYEAEYGLVVTWVAPGVAAAVNRSVPSAPSWATRDADILELWKGDGSPNSRG